MLNWLFRPSTAPIEQLARLDIGKARQLSRVSIHVEMVIGYHQQKLLFLRSNIPFNLMMPDAASDGSFWIR